MSPFAADASAGCAGYDIDGGGESAMAQVRRGRRRMSGSFARAERWVEKDRSYL